MLFFNYKILFISAIATNNQEINHRDLGIKTLNEQKLLKLEQEIGRYRERMDNESFRKSAKPQVQQQHMEKVI